MRNKRHLFSFSAALLFALGMQAAETTDTLTMSIQAMHCGKCAHKVSAILQADKGIDDYVIDEERRTVTVVFDNATTSRDSIMARLAATKRYIPKVYSCCEVMPRTIKEHVADMHCGKCKQRIAERLGGISGVDSISVDLPAQDVLISYDANKTRRDSLLQALTDLGFTPVEVPLHHGETVKGISFAYFNIPEEAANDNTADEVMAILGIADVSVNPKKKTMAVSYADKYFTQDTLIRKLREEGIQVALPPVHECKEKDQ